MLNVVGVGGESVGYGEQWIGESAGCVVSKPVERE